MPDPIVERGNLERAIAEIETAIKSVHQIPQAQDTAERIGTVLTYLDYASVAARQVRNIIDLRGGLEERGDGLSYSRLSWATKNSKIDP